MGDEPVTFLLWDISSIHFSSWKKQVDSNENTASDILESYVTDWSVNQMKALKVQNIKNQEKNINITEMLTTDGRVTQNSVNSGRLQTFLQSVSQTSGLISKFI